MREVEVLIRIPEVWIEAFKAFKYPSALQVCVLQGTVLSKGQWIQQPRYDGDDQPNLVCPNCGFKISWWDMGNFCAKCGKGLEGGAE